MQRRIGQVADPDPPVTKLHVQQQLNANAVLQIQLSI